MTLIPVLLFISLFSCTATAQLSPTIFYNSSCPNLESIVQPVVQQSITAEPRMGGSLLRLFFHDCFVQGCDASVLLDAGGEKTALGNFNTARGYHVIDSIKSSVEDLIALAARDSVVALGGPTWSVPLGRRDSTTGNQTLANTNLPVFSSNLATLISMFGNVGLSPTDMTALSGAHTIGQARCLSFRDRIYKDTDIDPAFAALRKQWCPQSGGDDNTSPLDEQTPNVFDNAYYQNLVARRAVMHSDQELFSGGSQDSLVQQYAGNTTLWKNDFVTAMIKMGNISPLTGTASQIDQGQLHARQQLAD